MSIRKVFHWKARTYKIEDIELQNGHKGVKERKLFY